MVIRGVCRRAFLKNKNHIVKKAFCLKKFTIIKIIVSLAREEAF